MKYLSAVGCTVVVSWSWLLDTDWTVDIILLQNISIQIYRLLEIGDRDKKWKDYCGLNLYFSDPIF